MICTEASLNPNSIIRAENAAISMFLSSLECRFATYQPGNIMPFLLLMEAENHNEMEILEHLYMMSERGEQDYFFDETIDIGNSEKESTHKISENARFYRKQNHDFMANFHIYASRSAGNCEGVKAIFVTLPSMKSDGIFYSRNSNKGKSFAIESMKRFEEQAAAATRVRYNVDDDDLRLFNDMFKDSTMGLISVSAKKESLSKETITIAVDQNKLHSQVRAPAQLSFRGNEITDSLPSYMHGVSQRKNHSHVTTATRTTSPSERTIIAAPAIRSMLSFENDDAPDLFSNFYGEISLNHTASDAQKHLNCIRRNLQGGQSLPFTQTPLQPFLSSRNFQNSNKEQTSNAKSVFYKNLKLTNPIGSAWRKLNKYIRHRLNSNPQQQPFTPNNRPMRRAFNASAA